MENDFDLSIINTAMYLYNTKDEILTDKEKGNDYDVFESIKSLALEFLASNYDNEDEDIEDTTRTFLLNKKINV